MYTLEPQKSFLCIALAFSFWNAVLSLEFEASASGQARAAGAKNLLCLSCIQHSTDLDSLVFGTATTSKEQQQQLNQNFPCPSFGFWFLVSVNFYTFFRAHKTEDGKVCKPIFIIFVSSSEPISHKHKSLFFGPI